MSLSRILVTVLQAEIGNAETASWILSCMQLVGILAGVSCQSSERGNRIDGNEIVFLV